MQFLKILIDYENYTSQGKKIILCYYSNIFICFAFMATIFLTQSDYFAPLTSVLIGLVLGLACTPIKYMSKGAQTSKKSQAARSITHLILFTSIVIFLVQTPNFGNGYFLPTAAFFIFSTQFIIKTYTQKSYEEELKHHLKVELFEASSTLQEINPNLIKGYANILEKILTSKDLCDIQKVHKALNLYLEAEVTTQALKKDFE